MTKSFIRILLALALLFFSSNMAFTQQNISLSSYNGQSEIKGSGSITLTNGFHVPEGNNLRVFTTLQNCTILNSAPSNNQNYILTRIFKIAGVNNLNINDLRNNCEENQTVQYFDGLGRPIQNINIQASPNGKDVVQQIEYDALGRETKKYLPYAEQYSNDGSFKVNATTNQANYYSLSSWDVNTSQNTYPFSQASIETSPLNRLLEQGAPGAPWQPYNVAITGSGHTIKSVYDFNITGEVQLWTINPTGGSSTSNSYPENTLHKTILKDENWVSGKAGTVEEFKDLQNNVVLKRVWETESTSLSTYYVYDDLNNLRYVLPPAVNVTSFNESGDIFENYIYAYHYDSRKRLIEKKIPGKGWEHLVYNTLDQLVLTQDAVQRNNNTWSFIKYDIQGRTILTGLVNSSSDRNTWQSSVNSQSYLWETRDDTNFYATNVGYSNNSLPTAGIITYHTANYYDDYNFFNNTFGAPTGSQASSLRTKGLPTATRINTLGTNSILLTVNYYDNEGRIVQIKSENHLGGTDVVDNIWNFASELLSTTRSHTTNSVTTTIVNNSEYDHIGRKLFTKQNINNQGAVVLNKLSYNEIGQLIRKDLHSTDDGSTFLQYTKYSYNERNWLKTSISNEFSIQLRYNDAEIGTTPNFNGNVSNQLWGTGGSFPNAFSYGYDALNRLKNANSTGIIMSELITYDVMGNINTLNRDGVGDKKYHYYNNSNRLQYIDGVTGTYNYDANGNAITDGRNGVTLSYNHLNLPVSAQRSGTAPLNLSYVYDATGAKLKKVNTTSTVTTDYLDGIQYSNNVIDFIQTEEGIARRNSDGTYSYEYNLADHLGNVRYTFHKNPTTGLLEILQSDDYYAFGKRKTGSGGINNYLYNGKEMQSELGVAGDDGQYDYGARFYDPVIGRWNVIDPLAEKFISWTPYNYVINNPIIFIDPNGMEAVYNWDDGKYYDNGREVTFEQALASYKTNPSKNENEEPPIDLFGNLENPGSAFHQVPANWEYTKGDGNFYLFGHGSSVSILYVDENGKKQRATTAEQVNMVLTQKSVEWKKAMAEGKKITLTIYACNAASEEFIDHNGSKFKVKSTLAEKISKKYSNITVIAPDGYVLYGWEDETAKIKGVQNHKNDGGFIVFKNGKQVAKTQQAYISPTVTKELPKVKIK